MSEQDTAKFVALLRGINVGGNKMVPMAELKKLLEKSGYKNVKTLLASGNVVFESDKGKKEKIAAELEVLLEKKFKFTVPLQIWPFGAIVKMTKKDPFKNIRVTKDTRLYVTFIPGKPASTLPLPYASADGSINILFLEDNALFSYLDLAKTGTVEAMKILEKEFGKNITTRNWNTVQKIAQM
ncbi:MAG TPA: DUF1697 domain-containing protein [Bacteroidia bacterium]|nr:DUF1697 domain-containing protein [Bacteroidia bacterium]